MSMLPSRLRSGLDMVIPLAFYSCHHPPHRHLDRFPLICQNRDSSGAHNTRPWSPGSVTLLPNYTLAAFSRRRVLLSFKGAR